MAIRPQCNRIVLTDTKEAAYGTAVVNGSILDRFDPREPITLSPTKEKVDDSERIKGHEFPEDPQNQDIIIARDLSFPFSFDASLEVLGNLFASAFGANSVAGSTPNFTHTQKIADLCVSDQFPSVSWMLGLVGDTKSFLKVKGLIVNDLSFSLDGQGFLGISGTAMCDGTLLAETGYSFPIQEVAVDYLVGTQADFLMAVAALDVDACIVEDDSGVSFVDETTDANSAAADDVALLTPMDTDDAIFIGRTNKFREIMINVGTAGAGDAVAAETVWEYSKGSDTWGTLTGVVDATSEFTVGGAGLLSFDVPGDWATDTVNSQGPFYYIRLRMTAPIVYNTTTPLITQIGTAGVLASEKSLLRSFEIGVANNLDVSDARGNVAKTGSAFLGELRTGTRELTLSITVEGHQGDKFWQDWDIDAEKQISIVVTKNANRKITFLYRSAKIESIETGFDGIRDTLALTIKVFYNTTDSSPVLVTILNGDDDYLK